MTAGTAKHQTLSPRALTKVTGFGPTTSLYCQIWPRGGSKGLKSLCFTFTSHSSITCNIHIHFLPAGVLCNMLASGTAMGNVRATFLQFPFHLRLLSHQRSSRSFSTTASTRLNFTEIVAAPPLAVLNGLHAVGIPWYAAIPTAAILIRGFFGYYFASAPARRRQQIRNNLVPLVSADIAYHLTKHTASRKPLQMVNTTLFRLRRFQKFGAQFGAGLVAFTSFVNFGTLIATAEAVRMKCGAREGLLSLLVSPFNWAGRQIAPNLFPAPANVPDAAEIHAQQLAERIERVHTARLQQAQEQDIGAGSTETTLSEQSRALDELFQSHQLPAPPALNTDTPTFDATLQTEGFSWCTDLTAVDPYQILPGLVCVAMLSNVLLNPLSTPRPNYQARNMPSPIKFLMTRYSRMQYVAVAFAGVLGMAMQHMPAAVALYILSSVLTGFAQRRWLDQTMPLHKPIMPCARRTRVRSKRKWSA
jgi:inner membrane protein COX18